MNQQREQLIKSVLGFGKKGWVPATSSNFSVIDPERKNIHISISGRDKSEFSDKDLMIVDTKGNPLPGDSLRPSAETLIHTLLYEVYPANCVMHTHSVNDTVISMQSSGNLEFHGYEILKGLSGIKTHEAHLNVPIFENSQDMPAFSKNLRTNLNSECWGFLIKGHGLYTWGDSVFEAQRHVEVFQFLFECRLMEMRIR